MSEIIATIAIAITAASLYLQHRSLILQERQSTLESNTDSKVDSDNSAE